MKLKLYYTIIVGFVSVMYVSMNFSGFVSSIKKEKETSHIKGIQSSRYIMKFNSGQNNNPSPSLMLTPIPVQKEVEEKENIIFDSSPLNDINSYRISKGLPTLKVSSDVCEFAQLRVQEIESDFSHTGFLARQDSNSLPYGSFQTVVENIAYSPDGNALEMWKASSLHEENLRADIEFGCIKETNGYYVFEGLKP